MKAELQNAKQLEQEIQRLKLAVEELSVLNDLAIAASSSLEVRQMLDIIVQKSIKAVKAEQGSISLITEQEETPFRTLIRQSGGSNSRTNALSCRLTYYGLDSKKQKAIDDRKPGN